MKKLFLLLLSIFIFSCSSDDSGDNEDSDLIVILNPPEWIQGTWYNEDNEELSNDYGWRFENENAIQILQGNDDFNAQESMTRELNNWDFLDNQDDVLEETITDDYYAFKVTRYGPEPFGIFTYAFEKISSTEIRWVTAPTSVNPVNLIKQ